MPVTFNDLRDMDRIYRATSGGTVYSSNLKNSTSLDYFDDSPTVEDAIYFGVNNPLFAWKDLTFYVGTAMAGAYMLTWEYRATDNSWKTLSVTDNTNNFQNTGENTVTFTPPTDWKNGYSVNGTSATWIRVRLSFVGSVAEGGAQSTQKIQCGNFGLNVTGYSAVTPATLTDIYDEDVLQGWGVISNQCNQFCLSCNLYVGDGSTASYLKTMNEHISLDGGIKVEASGELCIGELISLSDRTTENGSALYFSRVYNNTFQGFLCDSASVVYLYDSLVDNANFVSNFLRMINCVINWGTISPIIDNSNVIVDRVTGSRDSSHGIIPGSGSFNDVFIHDCTQAIRLSTAQNEGTLRNLLIDNCTYIFKNDSSSGTEPLNIVDATTDTWDINWASTPSNGFIVNEQYSVNIQVLDKDNSPIQNTTIKLLDGNDTEVFSVLTAADGTIAEQIVTARIHEHNTGNNPGTTTVTNKNDFTLSIIKTGYVTKRITFTLDKSVDWKFRLSSPAMSNGGPFVV